MANQNAFIDHDDNKLTEDVSLICLLHQINKEDTDENVIIDQFLISFQTELLFQKAKVKIPKVPYLHIQLVSTSCCSYLARAAQIC